MATAYLDTSVLGRILLGEPDAEIVMGELRAFERKVASVLTRVELRRLASRRGVRGAADELLGGVALMPLDSELLAAAETVPPASVATLDAIHLATALRVADAGELDALMTFDRQLAQGAREHGLTVLPTAST